MTDIKDWLAGKRSYDEGIQLYFKHGKDPLLTLLFKEGYSEFKRQTLVSALEDLAVITAPPKNPTESKKEEKPKRESVKAAEVKALKDYVARLDDTVDDHYSRIMDVEDSIDDQHFVNRQLESSIDHLKTDIAEVKVRQRLAPKGWPADMDDVLKSLYDRWLVFFTEKKNLQARIYDVALSGQKYPLKKKEACKMAHRILDLRDECREIYSQRDHYMLHNKLPEEKELIEIPGDERKWPVTLKNWERYLRDYKVKLKAMPNNENFQKQWEKYQWGVAKLKKLLKYE